MKLLLVKNIYKIWFLNYNVDVLGIERYHVNVERTGVKYNSLASA